MLGKTLVLGAALGLGYVIWRHARAKAASSARTTTGRPTPRTPAEDTPAISAETHAATSAPANVAPPARTTAAIAAPAITDASAEGRATAATPPPMREPAIIRRLWRDLGAWLGTPPAERRHVIMCRTCGGPMIQTSHASEGFST